MDEEKICPLETTLKNLRFFLIWPEEKAEFKLTKAFYLKFILLVISTSVILYGSLAHMIVAIHEKSGVQIDLDIAAIISMVGTYYFNFTYLSNIKNVADVFKDFTNFQTFKKPPGYNRFTKKWNKLSLLHFYYYVALVSLSLLITFGQSKNCPAKDVQRDIRGICGLAMNVWLPFDFDYFPLKQAISCWQMYSAFFSYVLSSTISFSIMESMEHVIFRLDYVGALFVEALRQEEPKLRKKIFKYSVEYHNFVISLVERLNNCYSPCIFVHVLFTGVILGCVGFHLTQDPHLLTIGLFVGWYLSLIMVAFGGQRLMDKAISIANAIYCTGWYDVDGEIQKDIVQVLVRCQKPIVLRAGSFSFMSFEMIVTILKTSYTIISVMKGASFNDRSV